MHPPLFVQGFSAGFAQAVGSALWAGRWEMCGDGGGEGEIEEGDGCYTWLQHAPPGRTGKH